MISPKVGVRFSLKISPYRLAHRLPIGVLNTVLFIYIAVFFHQLVQLTLKSPLGRGLDSISPLSSCQAGERQTMYVT